MKLVIAKSVKSLNVVEKSSLDKNDALLTYDVQSSESINQILKDHGRPAFIFNESATDWFFDLDVPSCTLPIVFQEIAKTFNIHDCNLLPDTVSCFNFIVNKKMLHRYLCIRLIEYHGLTSYEYTYSGFQKVDETRILQDFSTVDPDKKIYTKDLISKILGEIHLPERFYTSLNLTDPNDRASGVKNYGKNCEVWRNYIKQFVPSTAISLVTESDNGDYDPAAFFTEKSIFAVLGLTFPIWIGSYGAAQSWEQMGLDAFTDIIDHSYQFESTMTMRCIRAINDNLELLKDLDRVKYLRQKNMPRLLKNLDLLINQHVVDRYIENKIHKLPSHLRDIANQIPRVPYPND